MGDVLIVAEHLEGEMADITFEMLGRGKKLAGDLGGACNALLVGGTTEMVGQLGAADKVITVDSGGPFNPEADLAALRAAVEAQAPQLVMIGSTSMGMDLAGTLSAQLNRPLAAYCVEVNAEGGAVKTTSQLYGGKMNVTSELGSEPCVVAVLPGSYPAEPGRVEGEPATEALPMPATAGKVRFKQMILPEGGDVDITAQEVLVAIGRGIGKKEEIEVAEKLAKALNAAVAASRPIIDAGWMPKSRQVGKSGLKVKPKVYLALGISGAPEHIEGMKSSATIIAVNTDKNAPIFDVAHYGVVGDLFDVCEDMMDEL
ncbi:MAG: electron transfer flavoprotein subunit alpha/FixB family protein [bacterium]